jgi:hypothetical protein
MMIGNGRNKNMVKQQKYTMNLFGPPLFQIFSREDISDPGAEMLSSQQIPDLLSA